MHHRLPALPLLAGLIVLVLAAVMPAPAPLRAAQPDAPAAEAPKADPAMTKWVRQVHAIVIKATTALGRRLAPGTYRVSFTVDEQGRGSNYGAEGEKPDARQSSMIMGALISRSFPAPPDSASHAVSFVLRNGAPTKAPAAAKPPADGKPGPEGAKP